MVRDHFRTWALSPEEMMPGRKSEYADKTSRWRNVVKKIPPAAWRVLDPLLFLTLRATRRNALVFEKDGKMNAHVIFQRHGNALHMFSVWVNPSSRGEGNGFAALKEFIQYAKHQKGITRVRIGGGNDETVNRLFEKLAKDGQSLGVSPRKGYWLNFVDHS